MTTNDTRRLEPQAPIVTDSGIERSELPDITRRREPPKQGGDVYFRCEGCGRESIYGGNEILHAEGCPRRDAR